MGNHTSAFRFRKLPSKPISFQTLKTSSSSTYTHQLASLSEMMFLNMRTSTKISALFSRSLKTSHLSFQLGTGTPKQKKISNYVTAALEITAGQGSLTAEFSFAYSSTDIWKPPIFVCDWLIFCCGKQILHQQKKTKKNNNKFYDEKQQKNAKKSMLQTLERRRKYIGVISSGEHTL